MVQGVGYGPTCAVIMGAVAGDLLTQPAKRERPAARLGITRRRRSKRGDPQIDLFYETTPADPVALT